MSGRVLDVKNISLAPGAPIQQWEYWGGTGQEWQLVQVEPGYYKIISRLSGRVLDVHNQSTGDGALIQQWDYWGGAGQRWQLVEVEPGYYKILSKLSGKVLDVQNSGMNNGILVQQSTYTGGNNQKWRLGGGMGRYPVLFDDVPLVQRCILSAGTGLDLVHGAS